MGQPLSIFVWQSADAVGAAVSTEIGAPMKMIEINVLLSLGIVQAATAE